MKLRDRPKSSTGPQSPDDNEGCYKLVMESSIFQECSSLRQQVICLQIGDSGVGKSCLLDKFLNDSSTNNFISTIGVDIRTRETVINNKKVKVQVWDTGGQQRYRPILASCYRGALGVIIVFDVTNKMSFKNIKQWMVEVDEFATDSNLPRILVKVTYLKTNQSINKTRLGTKLI